MEQWWKGPLIREIYMYNLIYQMSRFYVNKYNDSHVFQNTSKRVAEDRGKFVFTQRINRKLWSSIIIKAHAFLITLRLCSLCFSMCRVGALVLPEIWPHAGEVGEFPQGAFPWLWRQGKTLVGQGCFEHTSSWIFANQPIDIWSHLSEKASTKYTFLWGSISFKVTGP